MAAADKRAKLLSDLLAAKGGATGGEAPAPVEAERPSVISIAKRRIGEERPSEAPAAPSVLYSKGAATASTFRPSYWSFDHEEQAEPEAAPAKVEIAPAPPPPAAVARVEHGPRSSPLPINFVVAFGCVALFVSTTLFVLSQWHRFDVPAQPQSAPAIAVAPAPTPAPTPVAPVVSLPAAPPAESVAAAPTPAPVVPAPAPPAVAVAPQPAPVAPAPVASEPPPPAKPESDAKVSAEPPAVAASTSAALPAPAADPQQAAALLARGDDLLATGDVAAARLFYQRAAELGSAAAATAVGQTYDPAVLELLRVRGARGDMQLAAEWYRKAIAAGDRQAEIRLKRLLARQPG
jgi:hypothetical protein